MANEICTAAIMTISVLSGVFSIKSYMKKLASDSKRRKVANNKGAGL